MNKQKILNGRFQKTHGMKGTQIYTMWKNMKQRCHNVNRKDYNYYGGSGITILKDWEEDFSKFMEWAFKNGYEEGLSIDRIDNTKGYCPDNCRFITNYEQKINQRMRNTNTSGYTGISWLPQNKKWFCHIGYKYKRKNLGYFKNKQEALEVRNNYIIENNLPHHIQEWRG